MKVEIIPISEVIPYEKNPRKNDKAVDIVAKSIKKFGFKQPIVIDKSNVIIAGHTRLKAAKKLGLAEVPVLWADDLTPDEVKAYRIMDNKSIEFSFWDEQLLKEEFQALDEAGFDVELTGFSFKEVGDILGKEDKEDDFEIPKEPQYKIEQGEIWQLGDHRLMCGDSTKEADVGALMGKNKADMVFTDPPYGIDIVKNSGVLKSSGYEDIKGDSSIDVAEKSYNIIKECKKIIFFGGHYFTSFLPPSRGWLVWDKREGLPSDSFGDAEIAWSNIKTPIRIFRQKWARIIREGGRDSESSVRIHPTQKPVGISIEILKLFTDPKDTILDLFGGSGSTLIACEQTKRKCYMMEIDPFYCSVIIERWEKLTGKKGVKL